MDVIKNKSKLIPLIISHGTETDYILLDYKDITRFEISFNTTGIVIEYYLKSIETTRRKLIKNTTQLITIGNIQIDSSKYNFNTTASIKKLYLEINKAFTNIITTVYAI